FTIEILAPNASAAEGLTEKLGKLPLVSGVLSITSFVPSDQQQKLSLIADAATLMGPSLVPVDGPPPPTVEEIRTAAENAHRNRGPALANLPGDHTLAAIDGDLVRLAAAPDQVVMAAQQALPRFLPAELDRLRTSLEAGPVSLQALPADLTRDW